uniref:Uncharacterized protein n=1 Tax=Ursus americanus TaxID=9643 RepID=A0A452S6P6_URSAM
MYCDESEWFSWPWMRPSSLCGAGQVTGGQGRARPGASPPPRHRRSPGSPARRCAAASRPPPPCCPPPAGARPSPPPCSGGRGRGRVRGEPPPLSLVLAPTLQGWPLGKPHSPSDLGPSDARAPLRKQPHQLREGARR